MRLRLVGPPLCVALLALPGCYGEGSDGDGTSETAGDLVAGRLCYQQFHDVGEPGILPRAARVQGNSGPMDAIAFTANGAMYVFENDGYGKFTTRVAATIPEEDFFESAIADLNADGLDDVVITNLNFASVFMNFGGDFHSIEEPAPVEFNYSPIVGDFTGDGRLDIVGIDEYFGGFNLLPGLGDGHFGDLITGTLPCPDSDCYTDSPSVADFNGDGFDDVAVSDPLADRFLVYLSSGGVPFAEVVELADGQMYFFRIVAADVTGDGFWDVAGVVDGDLFVYPGDGAGGFGSPQRVALSENASGDTFEIMDLDADGFTDVVFVSGDSSYSGEIFVAFGNGAGSFNPPESAMQIGGDRFTVGYWNDDLLPDLFFETLTEIGDPELPPTVSLSCL